MSLIFDRFEKRSDAEAFVAEVGKRFGREGSVFDTGEESQASDPFPFQLNGIVVHIERTEDYEVEDEIRPLVRRFGGAFAGT